MSLHNLHADLAPRYKTSGIAWRVAGHGPPVLFIHGVGLNGDAWEPQIASLSTKRLVIAIDLPGHGYSDMLREDAALNDYVSAMADFIDDLGISPTAVVGHSLGALIALGVALDHPEKVTALVSMNAVYCRDPLSRAAVEKRAAQLSKGVVDTIGPIQRWFPEEPTGPLARRVADWLSRDDPAGYAAAYRVFASADHAYEGRLGDLKCRALFMTGVSDPNSTPAMSDRMAREAPYGRSLSLARARHMMNLTHPAETNSTIASFISAAEAVRT